MDEQEKMSTKKEEQNPSLTEFPYAERKWVFLIVLVALVLISGFLIFI